MCPRASKIIERPGSRGLSVRAAGSVRNLGGGGLVWRERYMRRGWWTRPGVWCRVGLRAVWRAWF
jgi:hypothetical protein